MVAGLAIGFGIALGSAPPVESAAVLWANYSAIGHTTPQDLNALQPFAPSVAWRTHANDIKEAGTILPRCSAAGEFFAPLPHPAP